MGRSAGPKRCAVWVATSPPCGAAGLLADPDELYAARIAKAAQIDRKEACRELADLEAAELLAPVTRDGRPRQRGRPARYLERRDADAWAALQTLGERFRRPPPAASGRRP